MQSSRSSNIQRLLDQHSRLNQSDDQNYPSLSSSSNLSTNQHLDIQILTIQKYKPTSNLFVPTLQFIQQRMPYLDLNIQTFKPTCTKWASSRSVSICDSCTRLFDWRSFTSCLNFQTFKQSKREPEISKRMLLYRHSRFKEG